jgi:site-specific DNA-cytosine methylase
MCRQKIMLDLISGSGSASKPFLEKGWKVYRYDIDPQGADGIFVDFKEEMFVINLIDAWKDKKVDLIWASPPCTEYSDANPRRNNPLFIPDTTLWKNSIRIIEAVDPTYWVLENVRGAARTWGKPRKRCGPYYLWGDFPLFSIPDKIKPKNLSQYTNHKDQARESAKIPYTIGKHLERAISLQEVVF